MNKNEYSEKVEKLLEGLSDSKIEKVSNAFVHMTFCESNRQDFFDLGVEMALQLKNGQSIFRAALPDGDAIYGIFASEDEFADAVRKVANRKGFLVRGYYHWYDGYKRDELLKVLDKRFGTKPFWVAQHSRVMNPEFFLRGGAKPRVKKDMILRERNIGDDDEKCDEFHVVEHSTLTWKKYTAQQFVDSLKWTKKGKASLK